MFLNFTNYFEKNSKIKLGKYFALSLLLRLISAIAFLVLIQEYFGRVDNDSFEYYLGGKSLNEHYFVSFLNSINILIHDYEYIANKGFRIENYIGSARTHTQLTFETSFFIMKMSALFSMTICDSYFGLCLIMTSLAFLGTRQIFQVFFKLYPNLYKPLAIFILCFPSVCFWSSVISKEVFILLALGFLFNSSFQLINKNRITLNIIIILFCSYILVLLKVFVLIVFLPAFVIWCGYNYSNQLKNFKIKITFYIMSSILSGFAGIVFVSIVSKIPIIENHYFKKNILETTLDIRSRYDEIGASNDYLEISDLESNLIEFIKLTPHAILMGLYRPYPWEATKWIHIPSAIENSFLVIWSLIISFGLIIRRKFFIFFTNPILLFCLFFSIVFAFIIGMGTANFGSLVRYKLPLLPFFLAALVILSFKIYNKRDFNQY